MPREQIDLDPITYEQLVIAVDVSTYKSIDGTSIIKGEFENFGRKGCVKKNTIKSFWLRINF